MSSFHGAPCVESREMRVDWTHARKLSCLKAPKLDGSLWPTGTPNKMHGSHVGCLVHLAPKKHT